MRGSKRERTEGSGVWELRVYNGVDPVTKKRRQVSRTIRGGARKADDALRDLIREVETGKYRTTEATVSAVLAEYVAELEAGGKSPYTLRTYRALVKNHLGPALGAIPLGQLDVATIRRYYRSQHGKLAPKTILQHHQVLSAALQQAIEWGWLTTNPARAAKGPSVPKTDPTPPTAEEVIALVKAAEKTHPTIAAFLFVAATTGARRGELCALRARCVDLERRTMLINGSVVDVGGGRLAVKETKTGRSRRLALDEATVEALRRRLSALVDPIPDPFVFSTDPAGRYPMRPGAVTEFFIRVRDRMDLPHVKLHHLRHFMASQALAGGVDIRTVSGRLGHARAAMTLDVYSHFMPAQDQHAADHMGELLQPKGVDA